MIEVTFLGRARALMRLVTHAVLALVTASLPGERLNEAKQFFLLGWRQVQALPRCALATFATLAAFAASATLARSLAFLAWHLAII